MASEIAPLAAFEDMADELISKAPMEIPSVTTLGVDNKSLEDKIVELEKIVKDLKLQLEEKALKEKIPLASNAYIKVVLPKRSNGAFGVTFGSYRDRPFLDESKVIIGHMEPNVDDQLSIGDFVIQINEINVQNVKGSNEVLIKSAIALDKNSLTLLILKPEESLYDSKQIIQRRELQTDYKCEFGIFVKKAKIDSPFRNYDELITINTKPASDRTIDKLYKKMNGEAMTFDILRRKSRAIPETPISSIPGVDGEAIYYEIPPPYRVSVSSASQPSTSEPPSTDDYQSRIHSDDSTLEDDNNVSDRDSVFKSGTYPIVDVILEVKPHESIGLTLIGGNKIGIYIKEVGIWSPAYNKNVQQGWQLLQIGNHDLRHGTLYYAFQLLTLYKASNMERIRFIFEKTPLQKYEELMIISAHDYFNVRALVSSPKNNSLVFKKDDIIVISHTFCKDKNDSENFYWLGQKSGPYGTSKERKPVPFLYQETRKGKVYNYEILDKDVKVDISSVEVAEQDVLQA